MWVIGFMGTMGIIALLGIIVLAVMFSQMKIALEVTIITLVISALSGVIGGAMSGLPSLLARMSNHPGDPPPPTQDVNVVNSQADPVIVEEAKP